MTWLTFWGVAFAGACVGYSAHLVLSWATVSDALEEAAESRETAVALAFELHVAKQTTDDAVERAYGMGYRAGRDSIGSQN